MLTGVGVTCRISYSIGANRPWCTMPGIFVGYTILKAHSIPFKMTLVCTLSVGGVLAWWLVKYVTYMPFYSVYEMRHKICIRYFLIDKVVILTPNIILIDR